MRVLLLILAFISATAAQSFQFVPEKPREIVRFKQQFSLPGTDPVLLFDLTSDKENLMMLGKTSFQVWDAENGSLISTAAHDADKDKNFGPLARLSSDGSQVVVVDHLRVSLRKEKTPVPAGVYDLRTGKLSGMLRGDERSIRWAWWSDNGRTLITTSSYLSADDKETELCFWDGETLQKRGCKTLAGQLGWNYFSKNGKKFFAAINSPSVPGQCRIFIWDAENAAVINSIKCEEDLWYGSANMISPGERSLALPSLRSVDIWDIDKSYRKKFQVTLPKGSSWISFGSFSPDEKYLAIKNGRNGTEIYDTRTGQLKRTLSGVDVSPDLWADDGRVLVSSYCGKAKAWSAETGALLYQLKLVCKDHFAVLESVRDDEDQLSMHPGGKYLLSRSGTAVRIWDAASGELLQTVVEPGREAEKSGKPKSDDYIKGRTARWSRDGKYFYVQGQDERQVLQYEFTGK
jgi:WD40 repeat protein